MTLEWYWLENCLFYVILKVIKFYSLEPPAVAFVWHWKHRIHLPRTHRDIILWRQRDDEMRISKNSLQSGKTDDLYYFVKYQSKAEKTHLK